MNCELIELFPVPDTFVSGLAEVEDVGDGCLRFTFFAKQHHGGVEDWLVVAKLVVPAAAVPPALLLAARAVGMPLLREMFDPRIPMN
jgi:hypothetical protein